ncbi:MAG: hypothetical protein ACO20I_08915 [bacterium]
MLSPKKLPGSELVRISDGQRKQLIQDRTGCNLSVDLDKLTRRIVDKG